ncbi:unnamed protein product [Dracunculus medinensis]|uniref:ShKT domain-containing protein n=1 Tax=Dracunculus medinensis TaxID=318479 RepID=A0A158Q514_DRAME|nr:unnamed protein product [Dracunculus medinensis]
MLLFHGFLLLAGFLFAQRSPDDPCDDAPTEVARIICHQLRQWDEKARAQPPVSSFAAFMPGLPGKGRKIAAELAPMATSPYQCMNLACLCPYFRGRAQADGSCILPNGSPLKKAVRKEYRLLSDDERRRFHWALRQLKQNGEYDKMARIHAEASTSGGAHSGPAFLPWHREFMKRMEIAIRQIDPELSLPYWDSVLDSALPQPKDSVLWTDELLGTTNTRGYIVGGDFKDFSRFMNSSRFMRRIGAQGTPFQQSEIDYTVNQDRIENVLAFTAPRIGCQYRANYNALEYTHGSVHIFVGGDMFDPYTSANDPAFYLHHSFVDYIWEIFRQRKQNRYNREKIYPIDNQLCSSALHFGSAFMRPFTPLRNVDGLSNDYTDNLYEYNPRPKCNDNCGSSRFLFCDHSHGAPRCASKAQIGGRCDGFHNSENVCYNGRCIRGICVASAVSRLIRPITQSPQIIEVPTQAPILSIEANCYNEHECCAFWSSKGECTRNAAYMKEWCKASCRQCRPDYDINAECADRHAQCMVWSRSGECRRNRLWMSENCRRSCNFCRMTRAQICGGGHNIMQTTRSITTSTAISSKNHCASPGCYNENVCCPLWGLQGQCSESPEFMACNCKVSCGRCIPTDYNYGTCDDYHRSCRQWAARGECNRNAWMLENCRRSCRSCMDEWELRIRCRIDGSIWGGRFGDDSGEPDYFWSLS